MDTLQNIADKNSDCGGIDANTGKLGCQIEFGTPLHLIGFKKGLVIPKDTVFDKEYIEQQTQIGNFIPLIGAESFEDTSSEDTMSTNSRGVERLSTPGLPKYNLTFEEGNEFYKELSKLTSFKALDFIIGDGAGNWKIAVNSNDDFTGFTAGQALAMMTKTKVQGGDPESKTLSVQFLNREQWDLNFAILERSLLDFSPEEIDGVNGVDLAISPVASLDDEVFVTLTLAADRVTPVEGWTSDNFLVEIDGTPDTGISAVETKPGVYTITLGAAASAGEVIVISSFDAAVNSYVVIVSGVLFRSGAESVTVA